jgi:hypothetical protein
MLFGHVFIPAVGQAKATQQLKTTLFLFLSFHISCSDGTNMKKVHLNCADPTSQSLTQA